MPTINASEGELLVLQGLRKLFGENNEKQLDVLEKNFFTPTKHVNFTKKQLMDRWGCKASKVDNVLNHGNVQPIGLRGRENEYAIEEADDAKRSYEQSIFLSGKLERKARTMQ